MLLEQSGASLLQIWTLSQHLSKHAARCTNSSSSVQQSSSILGAVKLRVYNYNYNSPDILKLSEVTLNLQSATVPRQDKLPISSPYWLLHWTFWLHIWTKLKPPLWAQNQAILNLQIQATIWFQYEAFLGATISCHNVSPLQSRRWTGLPSQLLSSCYLQAGTELHCKEVSVNTERWVDIVYWCNWDLTKQLRIRKQTEQTHKHFIFYPF